MAYSRDRLPQQGADDGYAVLVIPPSMLQLLSKASEVFLIETV